MRLINQAEMAWRWIAIWYGVAIMTFADNEIDLLRTLHVTFA